MRRSRCRRRIAKRTTAAPGSSPSWSARKRSAPLALSSVSKVACRCTLERVQRAPASSMARDDQRHAVLGQPDALADVPRDVALPCVHVVGQPRFGHQVAHPLDDPREPHAPRPPLPLVARVTPCHPGALPEHVDRAVLGDDPLDGPLARQHFAPAAGSSRHGDEREPCIVQIPHRGVGLAREKAVREERVVEIEEEPAKPAGLLDGERGKGPHFTASENSFQSISCRRSGRALPPRLSPTRRA